MKVEHDARAAILGAAAHEIARHGFHGMSMRDLARRAGTGLSSLYTHFRSKEEILFALHVEAFDALIAGAELAVATASDPSDRLHAFVLSHVRYFERHRDLMRVLVREAGRVPAARREAVRARKDGYFAIARDLLRQLGEVDGAELERAAYALFGMMNWTHAWYDPRRHGSAEDVARTIHRVATQGFARRAA